MVFSWRQIQCLAHQFGNCWTNRGPLNVEFVWDKPYSSSLVRSRMVDSPCLGFHAKLSRLERNCQQLAGMTKAQTGAVTIPEKGEILEICCGTWAWRKKCFEYVSTSLPETFKLFSLDFFYVYCGIFEYPSKFSITVPQQAFWILDILELKFCIFVIFLPFLLNFHCFMPKIWHLSIPWVFRLIVRFFLIFSIY